MSFSIPSTPSSNGPRCFNKCAQCRKLKRKCLPVDRQWPQRCDSCVRGNHPCGPNEPHHRMAAASQSSISAYTSTPTYTPHSVVDMLSTDPSIDPSFTEEEMPFSDTQWPFQPVMTMPTVTTPLPRGRDQMTMDIKPASSATPQKPKDLIREWLRRLDELRKLYKYLENRYNKVCLSMKTPRRFHSFDDIENGIRTILSVTLSEFGHLCNTILLQISQVSSVAEKGELLQRLKDGTSRYFNTAVKADGSSFGRTQIAQQHAKVLERLARHYEDTDDDFEAENLHLDATKLRERYGLQADGPEVDEASLFQKMSLRAMNAFETIKLKIHDPSVLSLFANNTPGFPATHLALLFERPAAVTTLLSLSIDAGCERDILGRQISHLAAENDDVSIVEITATESRDMYKMTPLAVAAHGGRSKVFKALADQGHDLKARDREGRSVLLIASGAGHVDIVRMMMDHGVNPNPYNLKQGQEGLAPQFTPLHAAVVGNHVDVAKILIQNKAMTGWAANDYDYTPTQQASKLGHKEMEKVLREAEAAEAVLRSTPCVPMERAQSQVPMSSTFSHYTTSATYPRKRTHAQSETGSTPPIDLTR